jgi:hypothetical protein
MPTPKADWRSKLLDQVAATSKPRARRSQAVSRYVIEVPAALAPLLNEAARRRGAAPTGFIRRAMIAMIAYDLGMRFTEVLRADPRWTPPGSRRVIEDPAGVLGGEWEIEGLQ